MDYFSGIIMVFSYLCKKFFQPLGSTRSNIMSPSIASIWNDNIVDDKSWIPTPLAPVELEDFARSLNVQLPTSAKSTRDYSNRGSAADRVVDLAKNIVNLRTSVCFEERK